MAEVSSGILCTSIARTIKIEGGWIVPVARVFDDYPPLRCEQIPIPRVPGRQHAIHHIDAARDILRQLGRHADAHRVTGPVPWKEILGSFCHLETQGPWLAD